MDNASVTWTDSILPFVNVQEISSPSKSQHKNGVKAGVEIPAEYIFCGNEKAI